MSKEYTYKALSNDQYKVEVLERDRAGRPKKYREHLIDLKHGDELCDCEAFYYSKPPNKTCRHYEFIKAQLKEGGGIIRWE